MVLVLKSDCDNRYVMQMVSYILGALPSSKLFANVREKMSLCYYCSSSYSTPKQAMIISSGVEHDNLEKAKAAILEQLTAIQNGDISDAELESARMSIYNTLNGIHDIDGIQFQGTGSLGNVFLGDGKILFQRIFRRVEVVPVVATLIPVDMRAWRISDTILGVVDAHSCGFQFFI